MESKDFSQIRHYLGKSQKQLARLLCVSTKGIQSFEGGWRQIPSYAERQLLFLLALRRSSDKSSQPCWEIRNCPDEWKQNCSAYEFNAGDFCWFISGTFCQGKCQVSWRNKIKLCRECEVFLSMIPPLI
ncbi:helix-turn-helix domain-containing protein [Chloroflexota bacterium]